jgi:hypothetical protein
MSLDLSDEGTFFHLVVCSPQFSFKLVTVLLEVNVHCVVSLLAACHRTVHIFLCALGDAAELLFCARIDNSERLPRARRDKLVVDKVQRQQLALVERFGVESGGGELHVGGGSSGEWWWWLWGDFSIAVKLYSLYQ